MNLVDLINNRILDNKVRKYQKEMVDKDLYSLTLSKDFLDKYKKSQNKQYLFDLYSHWDHVCPLDLYTGQQLEAIFNSPSFRVGIHRSSSIDANNLDSDEILKSIIDKGLVVMGDESSGSIRNDAQPNKTVSFGSFLSNMITLKTSYKGSNSAMIIAIPSEYVNAEGEVNLGFERNVFTLKDGLRYIKPMFVAGLLKQSRTSNNATYYSVSDLKALFEENERNR